MSIASEIQRIQTGINNAFTAIANKGGTIPQNAHLDNLATTISNMPSGDDTDYSKHSVVVIDYDGTILKQAILTEGSTFTLPTAPIKERLTFQSWSSPVTITNNTITVGKSDIVIGATYTTKSGLTEYDVTVNSRTGLTVYINNYGLKDWGDGTTNTETSHTYAEAGNYTILHERDNGYDGGFGSYSVFTEIRYALNNSVNYIPSMSNLNSLRAVSIPEGITSIPENAFNYNYSLKAVVIPSGVSSIGRASFNQCFMLGLVAFPSSLRTIGYKAFYDCGRLRYIILPEGLQTLEGNYGSVEYSPFRYVQACERIYIPSSVTSMDRYSFAGCNNLHEVVMDDNFSVAIPDYCFQDCGNLRKVHISKSVTSIGSYAFYNCYNLEEVDFPNNLVYLGDRAFLNCFALEEVNIKGTDLKIEAYAFQNCTNLKRITLQGVSKISDGSFDACNTLESFSCSAGLTSIGQHAFRWGFIGCENPINLILPEGLTELANAAFSACRTIEKIKFPSTIQSIYNFVETYGLRELDFSSVSSIPQLYSSSNDINPLCTIKVPQALYNDWIVAQNWSNYATQIVAV